MDGHRYLHICDAERLQGFSSPLDGWRRKRHRFETPRRLVGNSVNVRVSRWIGRLRLVRPGNYVMIKDKEDYERTMAESRHNIRKHRTICRDVTEFPVARVSQVSSFLRFAPRSLSARGYRRNTLTSP